MFAWVANGKPFGPKKLWTMVRRKTRDFPARTFKIKPDNSLVMESSGFVFEVKRCFCLELTMSLQSVAMNFLNCLGANAYINICFKLSGLIFLFLLSPL